MNLNFYETECQYVLDDQADNQIIKTLAHKYASLKTNFVKIQKEHAQALLRIQQLNQQKNKLQLEIAQLKTHNKKNLSDIEVNTTQYSQNKSNSSTLNYTWSESYKNIQEKYNISSATQEAKRKIIHGFVNEISSQLQTSNSLLKKQSMMLEQTRKTLQLTNQQLKTLRGCYNRLQQQFSVCKCQNKGIKQALNIHLKEKNELIIQLQKMESKFNINKKQKYLSNIEIDNQLNLIDQIYNCIQIQLAKPGITIR